MKIVIDARMINESGIGRYLRNLLEQLQKLDRENIYYVLLLKKNYDTSMYQSNFTKVLADFRWYTIAEQIRLPKILHDIQPDLVHFPHFNVSILYDGKFVVTIHDLIHQHYSMFHISTHGSVIFWAKKFGYKKVFGAAIKKSSKILVPSNFVKEQLTDEWNVDANKIVVTPEAVDNKLEATASTMKQGKIKTLYIFYVGNAHPHKNIEGLVKAFLRLKEKHKDLKLVLSGKENYFWQRIKEKYQDKDIIFTGFVTDSELAVLYKNATVYVEPSFEEGFGLPVLEAMSLGCPVVASGIGSLKEVGGDAVLYFDPHDIDDMVNNISHVLNNVRLRTDLIEKGKKRVKFFSWKKMAEQTLEIYSQGVVKSR